MRKDPKSRYIAPADKLRLQLQFKQYLLMGLAQKEACELCGISEKTGSIWANEMGLRNKGKLIMDKKKRDPDSLNAYIATIKYRYPDLYEQSQPAIQFFLKPA